jgi:hypothetical protein
LNAEFRRPRAHSVWARPEAAEEGAPETRIIHVFHAGLGSPAEARIGIRAARGLRKCGSRDETDWVRDLRVLAWDRDDWRIAYEVRDLPRTEEGATHWLPVSIRDTSGVLVEVRRSWIDDWWPSWNLVSRGVVVDAAWPEPPLAWDFATPLPSQVDLGGLPRRVTSQLLGSEVLYTTPVMRVGFRLGRPALSFLSFDPDGISDDPRDLLRHVAMFEGEDNDWSPNHPLFGQYALGPQIVTPDGVSHIGQLAAVSSGRATVEGATISYKLDLPSAGQHLDLRWTVEESGLQLDVVREGSRELHAVECSAWHVAFDAKVSQPCLIGRPEQAGETGSTRGPAILYAPGYGSLAVSSTGDAMLRFEAARGLNTTALEVAVGARPGELGDHILPAGHSVAQVRFDVTHGRGPALRADAPPSVVAGVRRTWLGGLTYRLDTATVSNNGNSLHVAGQIDQAALLARQLGHVDERMHALDFVRDSIDRYLDGGPAYMAGRSSFHDGLIQDEYVQAEPSVLLGIAHCLAGQPDDAWLRRRGPAIRAVIDRTRARDIDDDGLIESRLRTGVTGGSQWSTNQCDSVSFGWKDAYTNALLFDALVRLPEVLAGPEWADVRSDMADWARRLEEAYGPAFWNDATGWLAGWRSIDGELHDAGYLWVNGAAVTAGLLATGRARSAIERLWDEIRAAGFSDYRLGLPSCSRPIPRGDLIQGLIGQPHGYLTPHGLYMNGSASLTWAGYFITALRLVGMEREADDVIEATLGSLADGTAIGGCASGIDNRTWDGTPCGYEGILTYQFGVLGAALERYGADLPG